MNKKKYELMEELIELIKPHVLDDRGFQITMKRWFRENHLCKFTLIDVHQCINDCGYYISDQKAIDLIDRFSDDFKDHMEEEFHNQFVDDIKESSVIPEHSRWWHDKNFVRQAGDIVTEENIEEWL